MEKLIIHSNGTRGDYKFLPNDEGSYKSVAAMLVSFGNSGAIIRSIRNILTGNHPEDTLTLSQKLYLYRATDLLFNCEGERNISAFLTNIMFFDLVEREIYRVEDLPDRLPMAMKGAIQAARYTLDSLGGKYGEPSDTILQRQFFDYKPTTYSLANFGSLERTQKTLKEMLLHYELTLKDTRILLDWLGNGSEQISEIINLLNVINTIYDPNNKEFEGQKITSIFQRNEICLYKLTELFSSDMELDNSVMLLSNVSENNFSSEHTEPFMGKVQQLMQNIERNRSINDNIDLIRNYRLIKDGYEEWKKELLKDNSDLAREVARLTKTKKAKKIDVANDLQDFLLLVDKKLKLDFTKKLLESVISYVEREIDRDNLGFEGLASYHDESLGNLIREWYNIDYIPITPLLGIEGLCSEGYVS